MGFQAWQEQAELSDVMVLLLRFDPSLRPIYTYKAQGPQIGTVHCLSLRSDPLPCVLKHP